MSNSAVMVLLFPPRYTGVKSATLLGVESSAIFRDSTCTLISATLYLFSLLSNPPSSSFGLMLFVDSSSFRLPILLPRYMAYGGDSIYCQFPPYPFDYGVMEGY